DARAHTYPDGDPSARHGSAPHTSRADGIGADEHGGDDTRLVAAHAPGVVRAALDEDIAGAKQRLAGIEDRVDLALQDDAVVDRARPVHHRIRRSRVLGVAGADRLECRPGVGSRSPRGVRGKLDDAQDGTVPRRLEAYGPPGGVLVAFVARGRLGR